jgi:GNAT superfamily N-acetyltransferase
MRDNTGMHSSIRPLQDIHLPAADEVLRLAFRGSASRLEDLRLYRRIQPEGWFAAFQQERLVGMVGAACYGAFAHVGLMAVRPDCQRQGLGRLLMEFLLDRLEQQHIPLVTLDASAAGRPLYERLGFVACDDTLVLERPLNEPVPEPAGGQPLSSVALAELAEADAPVFGADRRNVFQTLGEFFPGRTFVQRDEQGRLSGWLCAQGSRLGPWVILRPERAGALLQAALALPYAGPLSVTVPSGNRPALELLGRHGFVPVRKNTHMRRGPGGCPGQRERVYSQTSLAVG